MKTRQRRWAQTLAARLAATGASPNQISIASLFFALVGCACLVASPRAGGAGAHALLLVAAAGAVQLRLLCNLLDGLVAVEGGKQTPTGEIYNDAPDRAADVALLAGAGYAVQSIPWGVDLGWAAAAVAVVTAYVRYLGASMGTPQFFIGPMAKQQRMAALTLACLVGAGEALAGWAGYAVPTVLALVVVGGAVTVARRLRAIAHAVEAR